MMSPNREEIFKQMSRSKNLMQTSIREEDGNRWESVLEDYLLFLRGCGRSDKTISIYKDQVSRFYRSKTPSWDDEKEDFLAWNGEPQIHTNHRLESCRRFWCWALDEGLRRTNPAENIPKRLVDKRPVANVDLADITALANAFGEEYREKPKQQTLRPARSGRTFEQGDAKALLSLQCLSAPEYGQLRAITESFHSLKPFRRTLFSNKLQHGNRAKCPRPPCQLPFSLGYRPKHRISRSFREFSFYSMKYFRTCSKAFLIYCQRAYLRQMRITSRAATGWQRRRKRTATIPG